MSEITIAQTFPGLRFQHLTSKNGLSDDGVTSIAEDEHGFIWFGTVSGLNRFDGYRVKKFFHDPVDTTSLSGNFITQMLVDAKNNLWISTGNGLSYFNTRTQKSTNFSRDFNKPRTFFSDVYPHIYLDSSNNAWVSTNKSLFRFDSNFNYHQSPEDMDSFRFRGQTITAYNAIVEDKKKQLWAYSLNRIFLLDTATKKVTRTFESPNLNIIYRLFFDSHNRCWVVTRGDGLYLFTPEENHWTRVDLGGNKNEDGFIAEWGPDDQKYIIYTSENSQGLALIDPETLHYKYYYDDALDNPMLSGFGIGYIFVDRQNILWIGTQGGISYITPSSLLFDVIPIGMHENLPDFSRKKIVFDIYGDEKGYWVGKWYTGGVFQYSKDWKLKKFLPALYPFKASQPNLTSMACEMHLYKDKLYITTDSGLVELDTVSYHSKVFQPADTKEASTMRTIASISETKWWVSTFYFGIFIFDVSTGQFIKHYQHQPGCTNCLPEMIWEIMTTRKGDLFVCSLKGLFKYQPEKDNFISYKKNQNDPITFPSDSLYGLVEDSIGKLWIATNNGVCIFDPVTAKVEKVFSENKQIGAANAICIDRYQNIWFASASGDWAFIHDKNKLINFSHAEGLPRNTADGILTANADGYVYNGGLDAMARFHPERLENFSFLSKKSLITEAETGNNAITIQTNQQNEKFISLLPDEKLFTVDFALLNYDAGSGNNYYYRLLPVSQDWQQNNNGGHLSFYDLNPGKYRLEVKGNNSFDGTFSDTDFILIIINPPWWQSWWFGLIIALMATAIISFLIKRRIAFIRKEAGFKQKIAETEMQALRTQMNPHFIFNSLNGIENFMMKNEKRIASDYLSKFALLVRMILDSSRNDLVLFSNDLEAIQLYVDLEQLRFNNKFIYKATVDPILLNGDYHVPPLLIQPFVENAIMHGLSQSDRTNLELSLTASLENGYILYSIEDNGIGRQKSAAYTRQNKPSHKSMGIQITQERINIFNQQQHAKGAISITDLYDANGEAAGTKVQVKVKAI